MITSPEQAFYMVGGIDEVIAKVEKALISNSNLGDSADYAVKML